MNYSNNYEAGLEELNAYMGIASAINSSREMEQILRGVLIEAQRVVDADAATLWLVNGKTELIEPLVVIGPKIKEFEGIFLKKGEGIAGKVIEQREAALVTDVLNDPSWADRIDFITGFTTRSILTVPIIWDEKAIGCFQFVNKRDGNLFSKDDLRFGMSVSNLSAMVIVNTRLYEEQRILLMSITRTLSAAIDARDPYTKGHSERVKQIAVKVGEKLGFDAQELEKLEMAAFLHDIGKIGIPDNILLSQDKLTIEEYDRIKEHTNIGAKIISMIEPSSNIEYAYQVALYHQEKFDGTGYPTGLKGNDIPLMARIVGIADAFDAMTSYRPYRKTMSMDEAAEELVLQKGTQFDPELVDAMLSLINGGGVIIYE